MSILQTMTDRYAEIDAVIEFIHQHMDEPLSLSRLARYAAYSPYHFTRLFKDRTGLSPLYYVSSLRLQKAKDLLLRTNLSVRDIAVEIGQQSLGTFTTSFTGSTDEQVLAWARRDQRILLTFDKDFGEMVFDQGSRASIGILLFRLPLKSPGVLIGWVVTALNSRLDWEGHFTVIQPGRIRMRRLPARTE